MFYKQQVSNLYIILYRIYTSKIKFDIDNDLASYSRSARLTDILTKLVKQKNLHTSHMIDTLYDTVDVYAIHK